MSAVWKKRSTSMSVDVDVDINEFEETALLQGLIDSGWLSEEEAEKIRFRAAQTNVSEPKNIRLGQMFPEKAEQNGMECATEIVDRVIFPALPVWQPIETAPKEHGEYVLLWIPGKNRRAIGWWDRDRYSKRPRPFWIWTIGSRHSISDCRANPPTHWQHLPMPPEAK